MRKIKGMTQFKKRWLTLAEAASELSTDEEGLRQAMESGDLNELPIFAYSGAGRFPAQLIIAETERPFDELPADVDGYITPQDIAGTISADWFWLAGIYRISPQWIMDVARHRTLLQCLVSPLSWWKPDCQVLKYGDGQPKTDFFLRARNSELVADPGMIENLDPIFSLDNLRFSAADIAAIKTRPLSTGVAESGELSTLEPPGVGEKWPWGAHETQALRYLEAAAKQWWPRYDPADPTTAHTNEEVAGWLIKEHGVSERLAKSIASILRADGLPSGPRR